MEKAIKTRIVHKEIDLSTLCIKQRKNGTSYIDWGKSVGQKAKFVYDDIVGTLTILDQDENKVKIYIPNYTSPDGIIVNKGIVKNCNFGVILKKRKIFLYEPGDIVNHSRLTEQLKVKEKCYKYICPVDGYEGIVNEASLKQGASCPVCANQKIMPGVNDLHTTHPYIGQWLLNYEDGYHITAHTHKRVDWVCNICGSPVLQKQVHVITRDNHIYCDCCRKGVSYPEKFFMNMLDQLDICYKKEYSPKWAGNYRYDYYFKIGSQNYIVELDGGFHYIDNKFKGLSVQDIHEIDLKKDKIAKAHNIIVIRINCDYKQTGKRYEYIKTNILNSNLSKIFNMQLVNFELCHQYASSSLYQIAIQLFNDGADINTIVKQTKLGYTTIREYLKDGTKSGLCKYDNFHRLVPLYCTDTKQAFASSTILLNNSKKIFGITLKVFIPPSRNITCCHGIHFKRISKEEFNSIKKDFPELAFGDFFII